MDILSKNSAWNDIFEHEKKHRGFDWKAALQTDSGEIDFEAISNHVESLVQQATSSAENLEFMPEKETKFCNEFHLDEEKVNAIISKTGSQLEDEIRLLISQIQAGEERIKASLEKDGKIDTSLIVTLLGIAGTAGGAITGIQVGPIIVKASLAAIGTGATIAVVVILAVIVAIIAVLLFVAVLEVNATFLVVNYSLDKKINIANIYNHHGKTTVIPDQLDEEKKYKGTYTVGHAMWKDNKKQVACSFLSFSKLDAALYGIAGTTRLRIVDALSNIAVWHTHFTQVVPITFLGGNNGVYLTDKDYKTIKEAYHDGNKHKDIRSTIGKSKNTLSAKMNSKTENLIYGTLVLK